VDIDYSGLQRHRPDLIPAARAASEILESEVGLAAPFLRAEWDILGLKSEHKLVYLELSDNSGSVGYRFWPDELLELGYMKVRLHRLWGDLMMIQSHVRLDNLRWQYAQYAQQEGT
jgi:hypothetical protein